MAKKSRRPVRGDTSTSNPAQTSSSGAPATPKSTSTSTSTSTTSAASATGKPSRRPRSRRTRQQTLFERYRSWIIGGAAVAGIVIIAFVFFQGANTKAYTCTTLLAPGPVESLTPQPSVLATPTNEPTTTPAPSGTAAATEAPGTSGTPGASEAPGASATPGASETPAASPTPEPTPVPEPTPRLGFTTDILGRTHVQTGSTINYAYCPPTSGSHYLAQGRGPIPYQVYGPNEEKTPGGWIHNLEHGAVVMLYRCPSGVIGSGDCITQAEFDEMRTWFDNAPPNEVAASCPDKVLVARFDSMETKFAQVAWGRALLTNDFDLDRASTFDQQWREHDAVPEASAC